MAEEFTKAFVQRVLQRLGSNMQLPASQLDSSMAALGMMPLQQQRASVGGGVRSSSGGGGGGSSAVAASQRKRGGSK
jgi:hypothetical protein